MEHQHRHQAHTKHIQQHSQIKYRKNFLQITVQKTSSENQHPQSNNHQHQLICDRHHHQYHRGNRNGYLFLLHKIYLHGLAACGGRSNAAEKETHRGEKKADSLSQADPIGSEHIPQNNRLSPYEEHHKKNTGDHPSGIHFPYGLPHGLQIFPMKNAVNGEHKHRQHKYPIPENLLFRLHPLFPPLRIGNRPLTLSRSFSYSFQMPVFFPI